MCLQAGAPVPVWGTATPGEAVTVTLGEQRREAKADADGRWRLRLDPLQAGAGGVPAGGGPMEMVVAGGNTIHFKNVVVGEVWLCGGQSNMAFAVNGVTDARTEIAAAQFPKIRLFVVRIARPVEPARELQGRWVECEPSTVTGFSAVAYFFGRELHRTLAAPIGLIQSCVGGTAAELWTSRAALAADPALKPLLSAYEKAAARFDAGRPQLEGKHAAELAAWKTAAAAARAAGKPQPPKPRAPRKPEAPSSLFNGMIAPLAPYALRGVIWYQGEANANAAEQYRRLFPALIADWRGAWGQGDFPFLFVQLANFLSRSPQPTDTPWARLRDAQLRTLAVANTGMAVAIDVGEAKDIHPKNKQEVGRRLALEALRVAHGRDVVSSGPLVDAVAFEEDEVRIHFQNVGGGLAARGGGKLTGFALAGEDRGFVWADARIDGSAVVVSSADVQRPVAVRYAWADNPECNLMNKEGLPASPFRTDDWERSAGAAPGAGRRPEGAK
ncbi:MAG: sialate O-acetylesterase [Planctomycetes bacterium]|nr:sialate O-acetylesterase [Planctomycetota bacterium]